MPFDFKTRKETIFFKALFKDKPIESRKLSDLIISTNTAKKIDQYWLNQMGRSFLDNPVKEFPLGRFINMYVYSTHLLMLNQTKVNQQIIYKTRLVDLIETLKIIYADFNIDIGDKGTDEFWQYVKDTLDKSMYLNYDEKLIFEDISVCFLYTALSEIALRNCQENTNKYFLSINFIQQISHKQIRLMLELLKLTKADNLNDMTDACIDGWRKIEAHIIQLYYSITEFKLSKTTVFGLAAEGVLESSFILPSLFTYFGSTLLSDWSSALLSTGIVLIKNALAAYTLTELNLISLYYRELKSSKKLLYINKSIEADKKTSTLRNETQLELYLRYNSYERIHGDIHNGLQALLEKIILKRALKKHADPQHPQTYVYSRFEFPTTDNQRQHYSGYAFLKELGLSQEEINNLKESAKEDAPPNEGKQEVNTAVQQWLAGNLTTHTPGLMTYQSKSGGTKYMILVKDTLRKQGISEELLDKFETEARNVCERKVGSYQKIKLGKPVQRDLTIKTFRTSVNMTHELCIHGHTSKRGGHERIGFFKVKNEQGKVVHVGAEFLPKGFTSASSTMHKFADKGKLELNFPPDSVNSNNNDSIRFNKN